MKLYKDKNLSHEINSELDLGEVLAGESKEFTFYIHNDSNAYLRNIEIEIDHPEIEIIKSPIELSAQMSNEIILKWTPSVDLKEGLKISLNIKRQEIWG